MGRRRRQEAAEEQTRPVTRAMLGKGETPLPVQYTAASPTEATELVFQRGPILRFWAISKSHLPTLLFSLGARRSFWLPLHEGGVSASQMLANGSPALPRTASLLHVSWAGISVRPRIHSGLDKRRSS